MRKRRDCTFKFLSTPSARRATVWVDGRVNSVQQFLSTPSARRATSGRIGRKLQNIDFYPRPPRGGRQMPLYIRSAAGKFLSTPSARRATATFLYTCTFNLISIHALREEGDSTAKSKRFKHCNFYPRPPRGGRRCARLSGASSCDFYPRPPRGGRRHNKCSPL